MNRRGISGWLYWAFIFLVVALVAGIFGFGLISGVTFTVAKWLAAVFVVLFVVSVVAHTVKNA